MSERSPFSESAYTNARKTKTIMEAKDLFHCLDKTAINNNNMDDTTKPVTTQRPRISARLCL
jgi:hypothetical protein